MRDVVVVAVVFGILPFVFTRPFWGILLCAWLGYMNPHLLAWGFSRTLPLVMITVLVTLFGMLISRETKRMVWSREIVVLLLFVVWMGITTSQAFYPDLAVPQYIKFIKIQTLTVMTLLLLTSRERVHQLVCVIALSLGFYGVKGGIFTILTGGSYRVQGPFGSFIGGNNEIGLALIMTIPLLRYMQLQAQHKLVRLGLTAVILLTIVAIAGTQSRGALLGLVLMGTIFWFKSRHKLVVAVLLVVAATSTLDYMPQSWFDRMHSIQNYEEDKSAQGRIKAWRVAINVANDRLTGGGFETFQPRVFAIYGEGGRDQRDVHSIYFEALGEQGYPGLILFLALLVLTWLKCGATIRLAKKSPELTWARDLAAMIQVSLVGYMTAGAFLGLAYFDLVYHLVIIAVVVHLLVQRSQTESVARVSQGVATSQSGPGLALTRQ